MSSSTTGGEGRRVLATGGASGNTSILQVLADVFNCPVYTMVSVDLSCSILLTLPRPVFYFISKSVHLVNPSNNSPFPSQACLSQQLSKICHLHITLPGESRKDSVYWKTLTLLPYCPQEVANSACLGSAYRAKHALAGGQYLETIKSQPFKLACHPNSDADQVSHAHPPLSGMINFIQVLLYGANCC